MTSQPDNAHLVHANKRHGGRRLLEPVTVKPKRTVYRRYQPKLERVTWYVSAVDASSIHGHARLFGYFRRERLWVLLETTGDILHEKIVNRQNDRTGLTITWKLSADMRLYLAMLQAATANTTTHEFVAACFIVMNRINRTTQKGICQ